MRHIRLMTNKVFIIFYAFYFHLIHYRPERVEQNKNILIFYNGIIGDAVLFADYLAMFQKIFPVEEGYQIDMICFKGCQKIWKDFFKHEYHINFLDVHIDDTNLSWQKYREVVQFFQKKYYQRIFALPIANPRMDRLVYNIAGKEKIICGENDYPGKWSKRYFYHRYFYEHAYNAKIQDPMETMEIRRYANLIQRYADFPVSLKIPHMTVKNDVVPIRYCVIGLGSSTSEKVWETSKFITIIQYLWDKYQLESYLCGEEQERVLYEQIKKTGNCAHIKSYIGKTNFKEWIALIKGAVLYVGNDSAGVHIAAAVSTPAIVIAGKWQYGRFFPYDKELDKGDEVIPQPVFSEFQYECVNCREKYMKKGIGNKACMRAVRAGKPCMCISDVTVENVKNVVDAVMPKQKKST